MKLPGYVKEIIEIYHRAGYEAFVVGGCVRDYLLGKEPHDYDIATNALPEVTIQLFDHVILTGLKHGTVTVLSNESVEVTTFRLESEYKDHRHPETVCFVNTIEEDLSRRDFTINAMAYNDIRGLIDPFHGQIDLEKRKIRCVNDPDTRFKEDALRMLRAHRFAAKLNFEIEEHTKLAIEKNSSLLRYISIERIRSELVEIMRYDPYELENMTELLIDILPQLKQCKECEQNSPWHDTDVLHHTLRALKFLKPFDETLAWAILMHDFGKPETKTTKDGRDHFYGHPLISKKISLELCKKFKLTNIQRKRIPVLIEYHDDHLKANLKTIFKFRIQRNFDEEMMDQLLTLKYCDIMAHSLKGIQSIENWKAFKTFYEKEIKIRPVSIKDLAINGSDVIQYTDRKGSQIHEFLYNALIECFYEPQKNNRKYWIDRMTRKK